MVPVLRMTTNQHGGARPNAGRRPSDPTVPVTVRLTPEQRDTLAKLGVAKWLRPLLDSLK